MSPRNDAPEEHKGVWVFIEHRNEKPARVSLELLGEGHRLAGMLGVEVTALLLGENPENQARELVSNGADAVIVAADSALRDYRTELYTTIIVDQILKGRPEIFLMGATCIGRDLAPRVAARLRTGCLADCTELDLDQEMRLIVASKPYFGRNVMADIICPHHKPQIVTVRPGIMELPQPDKNREGGVVHTAIEVEEEDDKVKVLDTVPSESDGAALEEAEKIVAVGMGAGNAEGFALVRELADLLGAELGATTLPIDQGWVSPERKIGQTGKTVRPRLYIGCGLSGAIQHTAGMINAEIIVAINKDPHAEIFGFADYGIVGDLHKIVPALIDELKKTLP
jgi:electron transfer flavoprotein alpha subunit